jgi:hypothetical protein
MFKLFTFCVSVFLLQTTFAFEASHIYEALDVEEVNASPGALGAVTFSKTAGRLECTKSIVFVPGTPVNYSCELGEKLLCLIPEGCPDFNQELQDAEIYDALKVKVQHDINNPLLILRIKEVGGLECTMADYSDLTVVSSYHCELR